MRRNSGNGGCVTNIIFLVVIYSLAVSANLIEKLEINFWLASGIVIALILCGVGLVRGIRSITIAVKRWKRCSHGVRRGKDGGCRQCIADEEHRQAEQRAYQARQDLKASIKRDASVLLAAEYYSGFRVPCRRLASLSSSNLDITDLHGQTLLSVFGTVKLALQS